MSVALASNEMQLAKDHGGFIASYGGQGLSAAGQAVLASFFAAETAPSMQFQRDPQEFLTQLGNKAAQRESGIDGIPG